MRLSATGVIKARSRPAPGFTLAELMIVIFIIGIVSGLLLMRAGAFHYGRSANDFAKQFAAYCRVVQQQAILQPAVLGLAMASEGYQIFGYDQANGRWVPWSATNKFWQPQSIPSAVGLQLFVNQKPVSLSPSLVLAQPQIIFSASGELTPFAVQLQQKDSDQVFTIQGNFAGNIDLTEGR